MIIIQGTEFRLGINVYPINDWTLTNGEFKIEVYTSKNSKLTFTHENKFIKINNNSIVIPIDTTNLKEGEIKIKFTAYIPDILFEDDGKRAEITVLNTGIRIKRE
jgi:predicted RNA-binding protein